MTYDILGRKISTVDPDMGTWTYKYNAFGEMIRQTDAKGQVIDYEYDAIGRLTKKKLMGQGTGLLATIGNFVSSLFSGYASLTVKEVSVWTYDIAPMGSTSGKYALGLLASI
jgi:YD repeat-containing protein